MDGHLFQILSRELKGRLLGARLEKIQEAPGNLLSISFYGGGRKSQLYLRFGRKDSFCFLGQPGLVQSSPRPSAQVMRLRKYASARRVQSFLAQPFERKLWLLLGHGTAQAGRGSLPALQASQGPDAEAEPAKACWLLLDLVEGARLCFLTSEQSPCCPEPLWTSATELSDALANWRSYPVLTPALRRTLLSLAEPERLALLCDLEAGGGDLFLYLDSQGLVRKISAWPLAPKELASKGLIEQSGQDYLELFARAAQGLMLAPMTEAAQSQRLVPHRRRLRKLQALLEKFAAEEARLKALAQKEAQGQLLAANLWRLDPNAHLSAISLGQGADAAMGLAEHDPAQASGQSLMALDPRLSLGENMQRFFHAAKRGRRGLELLGQRRAEVQKELALLLDFTEKAALALGQPNPESREFAEAPEAARAKPTGKEAQALAAKHEATPENSSSPVRPGARLLALANSLPANVQLFQSSDGFCLLRGRDARGNLAALKLAAPGDLWLHVADGPGAHVVIRLDYAGQKPPERCLREAGALALEKSWLKNAPCGRLIYALARHVHALRNAKKQFGTVRIDSVYASLEVQAVPGLGQKLLIQPEWAKA